MDCAIPDSWRTHTVSGVTSDECYDIHVAQAAEDCNCRCTGSFDSYDDGYQLD